MACEVLNREINKAVGREREKARKLLAKKDNELNSAYNIIQSKDDELKRKNEELERLKNKKEILKRMAMQPGI